VSVGEQVRTSRVGGKSDANMKEFRLAAMKQSTNKQPNANDSKEIILNCYHTKMPFVLRPFQCPFDTFDLIRSLVAGPTESNQRPSSQFEL
jgi:hypothetical protein